MATSVGFQLGLLPERKLNKRALAASYGFLIFLLILMVNIGWIWPDSLDIRRQYHVTELIPMPSLQPQALKVKPPEHILKVKLLPKAPVFDAPRLTVPREVRAPRPQQPEVTAPKIEVNHFSPAVAKLITGGAHSRTGQVGRPPGGGQHRFVRSAARRGKRQRSGRDQRYEGHDCQRRFRQRDCASRAG